MTDLLDEELNPFGDLEYFLVAHRVVRWSKHPRVRGTLIVVEHPNVYTTNQLAKMIDGLMVLSDGFASRYMIADLKNFKCRRFSSKEAAVAAFALVG